MKPAPFDYHAPKSVEEAVRLLDELAEEDPKILAGGQSLVPMMNFRLATPGHIVDLNGVPGLDALERDEGGLLIGAMVRHAVIEDSDVLRDLIPLLPTVATEIGYRQIRYRGTVGGSICHADPAAEWPLVARLLEADLLVTGPNGDRHIDANDFFVYYFTTALEPNEVLTGVRLPIPTGRWGWGFAEFARKAGDFAIVAAGALVQANNGAIESARIALGGTGPIPARVDEAEQLLAGAPLDDEAARTRAAEAAAEACDPTDDAHGSSWYRKKLVRVEVERALKEACSMVGGS
jgi:carbon-monoxide dehydrogenase medium subunit